MSDYDENDPSKGDPKWNNSGGLWLSNRQDNGPRWRGQVQIDGTVYSLEGYGSDQQKSDNSRAPTIKLKASVREKW